MDVHTGFELHVEGGKTEVAVEARAPRLLLHSS